MRVLSSLLTKLCICLSWTTFTIAFVQKYNRPPGEIRYFTQEHWLNPLEQTVIINRQDHNALSTFGSNSTTTIPYTKSVGSGVPATYTNDPKTVYSWFADNLPSNGCVVGFDTERVPHGMGYRSKVGHGPITVQLATTDSCLVVQMIKPSSGRRCNGCVPILKALLCDDTCIKVGCQIDEDLVGLYHMWGGLVAQSRLDLQGIRFGDVSKQRGLKVLTKSILGLHLPKQKHITTSNWGEAPLSDKQIEYSARDAWAGAAVVSKLAEYDESIFGYKALQKLVHNELSIKNIISREKTKKQARAELKNIHKSYPSSKHMPNRLKTKASQLSKLIKANKHYPQIVDVQHLNIEI